MTVLEPAPTRRRTAQRITAALVAQGYPAWPAATRDELVADVVETYDRTMDEPRSLRAWLRREVRRQAIERWLLDDRLPLDRLDLAWLAIVGGPDTPACVIDSMLAGLTPRYESLLRLRFVDGYDDAAIAVTCGQSIAASRMAVHRGLKLLGTRLAA